MPTFQSVALDPRVRGLFLVDQSIPPPSRQGSTSAANNKDNSNDHKNGDEHKTVSDYTTNNGLVVVPPPQLPPGQQPQQQPQQQQQLLIRSSIATPRAMLTRSPQDLVDIFLHSGQQQQSNSHKKRRIGTAAQQQHQQQQQEQQHYLEPVLLDQMEGIRNQVAHKMIARTRTGQHLLIQQQQELRGAAAEPLIPGATVCALDAWKKRPRGENQEEDGRGVLNKSTNHHRDFSSTGCRALDQLLAFPPDWIRKEESIYGSTNSSTTTTAARQSGLTWGYVLQISGMPAVGNITTTGKTQLALQLAVNAIRDHNNHPHELLQEGPESISEFASFSDEERRRRRRRRDHLVKVRYCFSTGGHSGRGLAKRFVELLEDMDRSGDHDDDGASLDPSNRRHSRRKTRLPPRADQMEFQPISKLSQLAATLAALERDWVRQALRHKTTVHQNSDSEPASSLGAKESMSLDDPVRNHFSSRSAATLQGGAKEHVGTSSGRANDRAVDCENPPTMLVVDGLSTIPMDGDETQLFGIERWLKRIARQYSISVIVVSNTNNSSSSNNIQNGRPSMEVADFHLHLTRDTATTTQVQLIRHPAKLITEKDGTISLLHNSKYGMTVPE